MTGRDGQIKGGVIRETPTKRLADPMMQQKAVPLNRYPDSERRHSTCKCGMSIVSSSIGWLHEETMGIHYEPRGCESATPGVGAMLRPRTPTTLKSEGGILR